jgi:hypothetical protein
MKRINSILLACVIGMLTMFGNLSAQTYNGGAGPVDWQDPLTWGIPNYWPGRLDDGSTAILRQTAAVTFNNANPQFRVKALVLEVAQAFTLNGTGTLVIGALKLDNPVANTMTIGPGLNVVVDSIIDGAAGTVINVSAGATLTLRKGANAPNVQIVEGGTVLGPGSVDSRLVIENGFNNGVFPTGLAGAFINPFLGEVVTQGNFLLNDTYTRAAAHGDLILGGELLVSAGVTLTLNQTAPNRLGGTGTIQSQVGGIVTLGANFNAGIIPAARFANPFIGQLQTQGAAPFLINGNMTLGVANGNSSQQGVLNISGANQIVTVAAGATLTLNGTIANSLQGAPTSFLEVAEGGTLVLGPGFNAGTIPPRIRNVAGTLRTSGALQLNVAPFANPIATTGTLDLGGNLELIGAGVFRVSQTSPNSLRGVAGARISAQGPNTFIQFCPNANNGVIPGDLLANPFDGGIVTNGPFNFVGTLVMGSSSGPWIFDVTSNNNGVVTIQSGAEISLNRNTPGAVFGVPVNNPAGSPGAAYRAYFQGVSSSSTLRLGPGFNGGTVPRGDASVVGNGATSVGTLGFLPLPFVNATTSSVESFNGRLILEGSLTFDRDLRIGPNGSLVLNGNYTVAAGRALQLYNQGLNTVTGTGFIQGVAPTSAGAATRHTFAPVGGTAAAAVRTAHGSIVELGPGFNGATIPAARFASPFQGNFCVSSAGTLNIQGDLTLGVPGQVAYLNFNQGLGFQRWDNPTPNTLYTTSGTSSLIINPNSSLTLNGVARATIYGAAGNRPGVAPPNTIQGTDITSRLIIGRGHGSNGNVYARTTSATFLASPFNGSLEFESFTYLATDATLGVNSQLLLGGDLIITEATLRGVADSQFPTGPFDGQQTGKTLTLLNQGANTIGGVGTIQAGTGNTVVLGANANAGIIPGARFANPYFGTIATVGAMTQTGIFTLGGLRDGRTNTNPAAHFVSSGFMALGGKWTVDNGAVLTVSNATVHPIVNYDPLTFALGQPRFQTATAGTAVIDALPGGEVRFADGLAAADNPRMTAAASAIYTTGHGFIPPGQTTAQSFISRSNLRAEYIASPFQGRLTIGSLPGGASRFNLTSGTLTLGPTASLNIVSPLYVSSASASPLPILFTNGLPRVNLNMTGAGSLTATTTGSFIQSSVGSFSNFGGGVSSFIISGGNPQNPTGGTITLGTGFNGNVIPGNIFGEPGGFSGRLLLPPTGNFTLQSDLTMLSPSWISAAAPGLKPLNYGILDLGGPDGTTILTIADGVTLSLGTTNSVMLLNTGRALQGSGRIQGATNNARLVFNGNSGGASSAAGNLQFNHMHVTAANLVSPFNGRLEINTNANAYVVGDLVIGAPNTANGILRINTATGDALVPPFNKPLFIPAGNASSITLNNTSPVAVVLPGNGAISATSNFSSIILGPNALANIIPALQLSDPFIGRLIVATTGTGASNPFALNSNLRLANDFALRDAPGARNGYLGVFTPINIASGIELAVQNTSQQSLYGTATIQGADGNATVRFLSSAAPAGAPFAGNANVVPGALFANPYNGRVALESNAANQTGYHLYGALTLGAIGSNNGFLSVSGATLYLAAAGGVPATGTEATLTVNNVLPVEQVLPGGGAIYPKGEVGGNANNRNSRWIFGLGALANVLPLHKSTSGTAALPAGNLFAANTLPNLSDWRNGIQGTIITPNGSMTATNASVAFNNGGTLVIGGAGTAGSSTTAEVVLQSPAQRLTFGSAHANALGGIGVIRATVTNATVRFNAGANAGIIPGDNFSKNYNGSIDFEGPMTQTGVLRLGDGTATTGRLQALNTGGALYTIGANATLDLRTVTGGIGNTSATAIAGGLVSAAGGTSTLILHPNFETGVGVGTPTPALVNQGRALLTTPYNGVLIASTGTTNLDFGNLTIGATGALEIGGDFVVIATRTLTMNQTAANSFRRTSGLTGLLLANPAANVAGPATVTLGAGFNNLVLPVNLLGSTSGNPNQFGVASPHPNPPFSILRINGSGNPVQPLTLSSNSGAFSAPANLTVNGDLEFTAQGGGILIPASTTLRVLGGYSAAATASPIRPGFIQGTTGFGTTESVLSFGAGTRVAGNTIDANAPRIGGVQNADGFVGKLRFEGNGIISGISVTLATNSALDIGVAANSRLSVLANSTLNLNNQAANSLIAGTGGLVSGTAATAVVNLGAGFNNGLVPGQTFRSELPPNPPAPGVLTVQPFAGSLRILGSLALSSALEVGNNGVFDFVGSDNKLTLNEHNATITGTVQNANATRYFITNGVGALTLGNVGNVTFPVGPTSDLFTPININNNAAPSQFSVRALASPTQAAPAPQVRVNQQWNVTQVTGVTPGFPVSISPFWLPSQESPGFSRAFAVANAFTPSGTVSSSPGQATNDPLFTNYLRNTVTVVQGATNQLNNTPILVTSQPIPNILAFTPMAQTSGGTVTITGNRFVAGASVSLGGVPVPMSAITFISGGASGIDTLRVVVPANAASGNVVVTQTAGSSTAPGFVFLGAPLVPSAIFKVTPSPIPAGIGDVEVIIDGAAFGSNTLRVVAVGSGITSTIVPSSSSVTRITATIPGQVVRVPGTLQLTVTSLDRLPSSTNVTITTPPALSLTSLAPSSTSGNLQPFTIAVNGSNFSAQSAFTLNGVVLRVVSVTPNANGTLTARVELPAGVRSGDLTITNINGQSASLPFVVNSLPRPIITSVNPVLLPPGSPNTTITINGRFLVPGAQVFFNGQPLTGVQLTGDSLIRVTIPAALLANPDLAVLTVTNPDGQSIGYRLPITTAAPGALTVNLNGVTPGSTTGTGRAFQLQIAGTGFAGAPQVFLGGQPLTVVSTSGTQLVVNVPANLNFAGTYTLQIVNPSGVSTSVMYTINPASTDPAPAITRVNPGQFIAGAAGNITITGSGFATGARVLLGTLQLTVVSVSPTTVVATIPASVAAGTYQLSVVNPDGQAAVQTYGVVTSVSSNPLAGVRVYPNPAIESVSVEANLERAAKVVVTVTNALGQRVMVSERNAAAGFFSQSLDVGKLPAGSYMVEITDGVRRSVEKIIKN